MELQDQILEDHLVKFDEVVGQLKSADGTLEELVVCQPFVTAPKC